MSLVCPDSPVARATAPLMVETVGHRWVSRADSRTAPYVSKSLMYTTAVFGRALAATRYEEASGYA